MSTQTSFLEPVPPAHVSAFSSLGFRPTVDALIAEIAALYLADALPWIVGYSGGKDSTATLQLVWLALRSIPVERRTKIVHVISTDTMVENPIVAQWAGNSLDAMRDAAKVEGLPIEPHRLAPALTDSFWVNLIGRGYPAPRRLFRWCTERLKIKPSNKFILDTISAHGEAILVLGTRKAESVTRGAAMRKLELQRVRDRLSPNVSLPGSLVYSPVEDWSNDDVWMFLMQVKNPWGWDNKALMTLYAGASDGGECPLVVDTGTPSCGSSRFGCWVCTLVEQDKSMAAMIHNDEDKSWMLPLLDFRNALDFRNGEDGDRHLRDYRRMDGRVNLMMSGGERRVIPGPYKQSARAEWLRMLLEAERHVRAMGPPEVRDLELVSMAELTEIRRIWVIEKNEIEDLLPGIYATARGVPFPGEPLGLPGIDAEDLDLLREAAGDDEAYALARDLLAVEHRHRQMARRAGLYGALEKVLRRYTYASEEDAVVALGPLEQHVGQLALDAPSAPRAHGIAPGAERRGRATAALATMAEGEGDLADLAGHVVEDLGRGA